MEGSWQDKTKVEDNAECEPQSAQSRRMNRILPRLEFPLRPDPMRVPEHHQLLNRRLLLQQRQAFNSAYHRSDASFLLPRISYPSPLYVSPYTPFNDGHHHSQNIATSLNAYNGQICGSNMALTNSTTYSPACSQSSPPWKSLTRNFRVAQRRQYKRRSKTGCLTCRTRRIKCDETKPLCYNCSRSNRECQYPSVVKSLDTPPCQLGSTSTSVPIKPSSEKNFAMSIERLLVEESASSPSVKLHHKSTFANLDDE